MYYDKWWKKRVALGDHEGGGSGGTTEIPGLETAENCQTNRHNSLNEMASSLGVVNIGGIFVVLLCGLALAFVVAILEFCCRRDKAFENKKVGDRFFSSSGPSLEASTTEKGLRSSPSCPHRKVKKEKSKATKTAEERTMKSKIPGLLFSPRSGGGVDNSGYRRRAGNPRPHEVGAGGFRPHTKDPNSF